MLRRITYTSIASTPFTQRGLLDLLHEARSYNRIDGITGLLLHDNGHFLQVIEGPEDSIANLMARLKRDSRHEQFQIHEDIRTPTRLFPSWSMGLGELTDPALSFLPGMVSNADAKQRLHMLVDRLPSLADQLNVALAEAS